MSSERERPKDGDYVEFEFADGVVIWGIYRTARNGAPEGVYLTIKYGRGEAEAFLPIHRKYLRKGRRGTASVI